MRDIEPPQAHKPHPLSTLDIIRFSLHDRHQHRIDSLAVLVASAVMESLHTRGGADHLGIEMGRAEEESVSVRVSGGREVLPSCEECVGSRSGNMGYVGAKY